MLAPSPDPPRYRSWKQYFAHVDESIAHHEACCGVRPNMMIVPLNIGKWFRRMERRYFGPPAKVQRPRRKLRTERGWRSRRGR